MQNETWRDGFTLIEVLAVVMLLGILLAATLPAFRSAHRKAMRDEASSIAMELATAAMEFRTAYGRWPCEDDARNTGQPVLVAGDADDLQSCGAKCDLDITKVVGALSASGDFRDINPRAIVFLELPSSCLHYKTDGALPCPRDPWGRPFVMVLSRPIVNADGYGNVMSRIENGITFNIDSDRGVAKVDSPDDAAAFSWGDPLAPRSADGEADIVGSWGAR